MEKITRRDFLKRSAVMSAGVAAALSLPSMAEAAPKKIKSKKIKLKDNAVVVFQGDSITDAGRNRKNLSYNSADGMGYGYVARISSRLLDKYADKSLKIYNRGISADKVSHLQARWDEDCLALKPDVLSILVGVNDFWDFYHKKHDYRTLYNDLVDKTMNALPDLQLIICEPFAIRTARVDETWFPGYYDLTGIAREVAAKYGAAFVPYHDVFEAMESKVDPSYWSYDGIHVNVAGSGLMADAWLDSTGL